MSHLVRVSFLLLILSLSVTTQGQLNGVYTIGGVTPDYNTLTDAIVDVGVVGINGPVVFNIRDGVYNEQLYFWSFSGTSAVNTITFQSESSDSTAVEIVNTVGTALDVGSVDYLTFKHLTFTGIQAGVPDDVAYISFSDFVTVSNCVFNGHPTSSTSSDNNGIRFAFGNETVVKDNVINGSYESIVVAGSSGTHYTNSTIVGNKCIEAYSYGIRTGNHDNGLLISNNIIQSTRSSSNGIIVSNTVDSFKVVNNQIECRGTGVYIANTQGLGGVRPLVANNFITVTSTNGGRYAIRVADADDLDLVHNSVYLDEQGFFASSVCLYYYSGSANANILNNSFYCDNCAEPVLISSPFNQMDYCDFYTGSPFTYVLPPNSVSFDPGYVSNTDLHLATSFLDNLGTAFPAVTDDIDGEARNVTTPDIGADEYISPPLDAQVKLDEVYFCGASSQIDVVLRNEGLTTITAATIDWQASGAGQPTYNWSGTLAPGIETTITLGNYPLNFYGQGPSTAIEIWLTDVNGTTDASQLNDTTQRDAYRGLGGTYTIGGASPDFSMVQEAISAMDTGGVCSAVVFDIRDGQYDEQLWIYEIPGVSPLNNVTFQSENGDSSLVELFASAEVGQLLLVSDAHDISFRDLTFRVVDSPFGSSTSSVVHFISAYNIAFSNCEIQGAASGTSTASCISISNPDSSIVIENSYLWYASAGVQALLTTAQSGSGLRIEGNVFAVIGDEAVYIEDLDFTQILNNKVIGCRIQVYQCSNTRTAGNRVELTAGSLAFGIWHWLSSGGEIVNNSVKVTGTSSLHTAEAINVTGSSNIDIHYNTAWVHSAIFVNGGRHSIQILDGNNISVQNNVFKATGIGYNVRSVNASYSAFDHNVFYADGDSITANSTDIASLQVDLGGNLNSINENPQWATANIDSLYPQNNLVYGIGTPLIGVPTDIYGATREPNFPDPGAFEQPHPPIASLGLDTTACDSILLDARNLGSTYLWSTGATAQTISVTSTGSYWVQITNGLGVDQDTVAITIGQSPVINLPAATALCPGDSVLLDAQNAGSSYSWNTGPASQSIYASTAGNFIVEVTSPQGCISSDTAIVAMLTVPSIDLGSDTAFCTGGTILLDAGNPGNLYLWSTSETTQTIAVSTTGTYDVSIAHTCGTYVDSITVSVNPLAIISISGADSICEGETTTLNASGASTYQWSGGPATASYPVSPITSSSFDVVGTDANGCIDSASYYVYVGTLPTVSITGDTEVCEGDTATLTGNNGNSHLWSTGEVTQEIYVAPVTTQNYTLIIIEPDGCSDSATVQVIVNPLPAIPTITQNGGDLTSSASNSYAWYDLNSNVVGTGQTFTPIANGQYWVEVTDVNGCSVWSDPFDIQWIGIEGDGYYSNKFEVYPNPATERIVLTWGARVFPTRVEIMDLSGRKVYAQDLESTSRNQVTLWIGYLNSGAYWCTITGKATQCRTLVIKL